jgi:DNA polymerase elongation subunit (family B)
MTTMAGIDLDALCPSRFRRLVAVEPGADGTAALFERCEDGTVAAHAVEFHPFLLLADPALAGLLPDVCGVRELAGPGVFRARVHFPGEKAYAAALKTLKAETGRNPSDASAPYRAFSDFTQQLLSLLPARLFRSMTFGEIRRLQLDIETRTSTGYDFPNADRAEDAVIIVALRDSTGWEKCLSLAEFGGDEGALLKALVAAVRERDPDVIEGHNLCNFDLPYLAARAKRHKVKLAFGRDGSPASVRSSRFSAGERVSAYSRWDVYGRHVVDTYHLVQLYDVSHRDLDSYGLKSVARHFGVAAADRTYVEAETISAAYAADPERVCRYAMDDVRETDAVSRILSPSYFYQAQLVPFSYQNCVVRGNGVRIDALLTAGYLERGAALPLPQSARPFQGALTEAVRTGVFKNVWHVDVASLYPSIMVGFGMAPANDALRLFPELLAGLRRFRLDAKNAAKRAEFAAVRDHFSALQSSFKILINSFYGYTGFAQGTFNDFTMAEAVTAKGREILTVMLDFLKEEKAEVIEMDTDGIYFGHSKLEAVNLENESAAAFLARMQERLPPGIEVELDAVYPAMFSYKSKNYALLGGDGRVSMTGAALKSRGLEPFQRRYIHELVTRILTGRAAEAGALFAEFATAIQNHSWPLAEFAQRETLSTSPQAYADKLARGETRRSAAYELALKSAKRNYAQGDQVAFYLVGNKKNVAVTDAAKLLADADPAVRDENLPYYLDKLEKLHDKFAGFLPADSAPMPADGLFSLNPD